MWDVFICHASEDKLFVRPLADELRQAGLGVWYDEFSLKLGDSLRRSIDKGLRNSRFGIVVLSRSFFKKPWPQRELDGLVAQELEGRSKILPIWHDISLHEISEFSPPLADRLAVQSSGRLRDIVKEVLEVVGSRNYRKSTLGRFPRFMIKEISDQPQMLADRVSNWAQDARAISGFCREFNTDLEVLFTGSGSSFHAAEVGALWFREISRLPGSAIPASEIKSQPRLRRRIIICISHSGETPEILEVAEEARKSGDAVIGVCGQRNSQLTSLCDAVWHTDVGPEYSVPATKSFTGHMLGLLAVASAMSGEGDSAIERLALPLKQLPKYVNQAISLDDEVRAIASRLARASIVMVMGRGLLFPIARHAAFRIKKSCQFLASSYTSGEFKHGPLALVDEEVAVLALIGEGKSGAKTAIAAQQIEARDGYVVPLVFRSAAYDFVGGVKKAQRSLLLSPGELPGTLIPFGAEVVLQLFSYHLGAAKGVDVDTPRHLLELARKKRLENVM